MKKTICLILLVCTILSCFAFQVYADTDYSPYTEVITAKKGDSFVSLCKSRGLDYEADLTAILILNSFAKEISLETVAIGQTIYLPKSDEDAKQIVALHDQNVPIGAIEYKVKKGDTLFKICTALHLNYNTTLDTIIKLNNWESEKDAANIVAGKSIYLPLDLPIIPAGTGAEGPVKEDRLEYYLVRHTMVPGETVESVCNDLGATYSVQVEEIFKAVNEIEALNTVQSGKSYLFPSAKHENVAYTVYSHKIVTGDTAGKLCKKYGVNYANVETLLEQLNPHLKLDAIPVGGKIYLVSTSK
ncbi:MAG: LysM peptidoglycan-binding domain-containing protein [Oscillospiraceae bacterium]|nr:LysM peptidoglycan-binding domain-containing protein [Oscillospiraceae bacterium]